VSTIDLCLDGSDQVLHIAWHALLLDYLVAIVDHGSCGCASIGSTVSLACLSITVG
jgi:hypothetical protein